MDKWEAVNPRVDKNLASAAVEAGTITITEQATASGFLDGSSFTNALVTVTFLGDTAKVFTLAINGTVSVFVTGIGSDTFTDTLQVYVWNTGRAGFEDDSACCSSVVLETDNSAFDAYGLTTSLGPISGGSFIASGEDNKVVDGSFGILSVQGNNSTLTATVGAVPEPGSLLMFGGGIACIAGIKLRRISGYAASPMRQLGGFAPISPS